MTPAAESPAFPVKTSGPRFPAPPTCSATNMNWPWPRTRPGWSLDELRAQVKILVNTLGKKGQRHLHRRRCRPASRRPRRRTYRPHRGRRHLPGSSRTPGRVALGRCGAHRRPLRHLCAGKRRPHRPSLYRRRIRSRSRPTLATSRCCRCGSCHEGPVTAQPAGCSAADGGRSRPPCAAFC